MDCVLITGAAGFIGYHLATRLVDEGNRVVGLDNFNSYYPVVLKKARATRLRARGVELVEGEVTDAPLLERLLEEHKPTHLVHLAAQAGVRHSLVDPQLYLSSNLSGFLEILELCRRHREVKLLYASSSSVYGQSSGPSSVGQATERPASFYAATKKCNELMAYSYWHALGVGSTALRFFTVYGPWGRPDMAYYRFAMKMVAGEAIPLYNRGEMWRDFTYIDDAVEWIVRAMRYQGEGCQLFNIGFGQPQPLLAMVEAIESCLGKLAIRELLPMEPGDVEATYAEMSQTHQLLGYRPQTGLKEGIERFIDWFVAHQAKFGSL